MKWNVDSASANLWRFILNTSWSILAVPVLSRSPDSAVPYPFSLPDLSYVPCPSCSPYLYQTSFSCFQGVCQGGTTRSTVLEYVRNINGTQDEGRHCQHSNYTSYMSSCQWPQAVMIQYMNTLMSYGFCFFAFGSVLAETHCNSVDVCSSCPRLVRALHLLG